MNARVAAILVVLLAVLGGGALLYQQQERARRPENVGTLGRTLFKDLKAADIAAITIAEPNATLTLKRQDERWVIAERADFPADLPRVREFVLKAIGLKIGQSEPLGEKDRARLNLDASGTKVDFLGADGKALGTFTVGRKNTSSARSRTPTRRSRTGASSACPETPAPPTWSATPSPRPRSRPPNGSTAPPSRWRR